MVHYIPPAYNTLGLQLVSTLGTECSIFRVQLLSPRMPSILSLYQYSLRCDLVLWPGACQQVVYLETDLYHLSYHGTLSGWPRHTAAALCRVQRRLSHDPKQNLGCYISIIQVLRSPLPVVVVVSISKYAQIRKAGIVQHIATVSACTLRRFSCADVHVISISHPARPTPPLTVT